MNTDSLQGHGSAECGLPIKIHSGIQSRTLTISAAQRYGLPDGRLRSFSWAAPGGCRCRHPPLGQAQHTP
ncbi:hypothetical protein BIWAKO_03754 [Bosea sp. BIWAKO-01]|nr:hypothetical protein BIWAKO_03754 [Bosea sp. BIWAKO-01]